MTEECKHQLELIPLWDFGLIWDDISQKYTPVHEGDVYTRCHSRFQCVECGEELSIKIEGTIVHGRDA